MKKDGWASVDLPHDWLIYDSENLYETGMGWYRKNFNLEKNAERNYWVRFDGIYMDAAVYVNGVWAGEWKYGYNTFELNITDLLQDGANEILVSVRHESPNSRWYSGAGIYRNVWFITKMSSYLVSDGVYVRTIKRENAYELKVSSEVFCDKQDADVKVTHTVWDAQGKKTAALLGDGSIDISLDRITEWSIETPYVYTLETELIIAGETVDSCKTQFGFRSVRFDPDEGLFLNGKHVKLQGVCIHHDLGALGAAFNVHALKRQLVKMKAMGANAIRTSHNMPAKEVLDLADEMGFLVNDEMFDMWKLHKTEHDYATFFPEWAKRDVRNFVRRDRNHPSVILWSIGNEIYDTHVNLEEGLATTRMLYEETVANDPEHNAMPTIGSNFLEGENTQQCADVLKIVGYNYMERLYQGHHEKYPDWVIYGSETASTVQSRGIYHFPYQEPILVDLDEQCSSLGNSTTSWGAKSTEACIIADRDTKFSLGQFIWTGYDYIGEPTPYQTKNSYFGQVDTAGFEKDSYYIYQAEWTDYKTNPMVHIFPFWDFNEGQMIDIRVCSNAPEIELFYNGESKGCFAIDHAHGTELLGHWQFPYMPGVIEAVAYDEQHQVIAREERRSFGDAAAISVSVADGKTEALADGRDMFFLEIGMKDQDGNEVENANNRVTVLVEGAGRLVGLDNGNSTDYESYKGISRRLFSGKLLAMIMTNTEPGEIRVSVTSKGLEPVELTLHTTAVPAECREGISASTKNLDLHAADEIPIRKIKLVSKNGLRMDPEQPKLELEAVLYPENCTCREVKWIAVNNAGVETNLAKIEAEGTRAVVTAMGDGNFHIRCYAYNGRNKVDIISQLEIETTGIGCAYVNPYEMVPAPLYDLSKGTFSNAEAHGIATPWDTDSYLGYSNVDFGRFGSDEIELPIFTFNQKDYRIRIWSGIPEAEGSELLADVIYNKPVIWNVYQPEKYRLTHRIKGVHTICIQTEDFINLLGFRFTALNMGTERVYAGENDKLYGDEFHIAGNQVNGIGNNVSIEFHHMDFKDGVQEVTINGRSYIDMNTIHIMFTKEDGTFTRQMVGFSYCEEMESRTFPLEKVAGECTVTFIFLPGSKFDFNWFHFQ